MVQKRKATVSVFF